jgi:hypothetical protein
LLSIFEKNRISYIKENPHFDIIYLFNSENTPLPDVEIYTAAGDGINISANHFTPEVAEICKEKGMKIGVWVSAKDFNENEDFYIDMFDN